MRKFLLFFIVFLLLLFLVWFFYPVPPPIDGGTIGTRREKTDSVTTSWINWNLVFTPNSSKDSAMIRKDFENYLNDYVHKQNPSAILRFKYAYCPCDSFLTNMDATVLWGSGKILSPPPTTPKPGPSGDYTFGDNKWQVSMPDYSDTTKNYIDTSKLNIHTDTLIATQVRSKRRKILAVIDTGLDTALFRMSYPNTVWGGNLLWQESVGKSTLFDIVPGEPNNLLIDNAPVKHGTAATQIILTQMKLFSSNRIPQIMSVRAFDDSERGSIFTVSCAISYAIKHHADYINASWGYYGPLDSVLRRYVKKATEAPNNIRLIAAAGNTPGIHDRDKVCNTHVNTANFLDDLKKKDSLFYPACFAPDFANLVSVTELDTLEPASNNLLIIPCYYQNYSSFYITVGALESQDPIYGCCKFSIPFLHWPIEGSSFATPVITAKLMSYMWELNTDIKAFINTNANRSPGGQYTDKGNYFNFFEIP